MITLLSGPPGCGKTYSSLRAIGLALVRDQWVATNVDVDVDAIAKWAWKHKPARVKIGQDPDAGLARLRASVIRVESVADLSGVVLPGAGESRGLAVLDEAQTFLNARMWKDDTRAEAVKYFTQHRKLGWDVLMISQFTDAIDRQVRALAEVEVVLRNARNFRVAGVRIFPGNMFISQHFWAGQKRLVIKREWFRLDRKLAGTYDTFQIVAASEADRMAAARPDAAPRRRRGRRRAERHAGRTTIAAREPRNGGILRRPALSRLTPRRRRRSPITGEVMNFDPRTGERLR